MEEERVHLGNNVWITKGPAGRIYIETAIAKLQGQQPALTGNGDSRPAETPLVGSAGGVCHLTENEQKDVLDIESARSTYDPVLVNNKRRAAVQPPPQPVYVENCAGGCHSYRLMLPSTLTENEQKDLLDLEAARANYDPWLLRPRRTT